MPLSDDPVSLADAAALDALDATIADADWPLIQALWRAGQTNAGIYRLLRFRLRWHRETLEAAQRFRAARHPGAVPQSRSSVAFTQKMEDLVYVATVLLLAAFLTVVALVDSRRLREAAAFAPPSGEPECSRGE